MIKQEFTTLPLAAALTVLWEALQQTEAADSLLAIEAPRPAPPPRFDGRCRTKGGVVYMSECDMTQLSYYYNRAIKPTEEKYRERSEKEAKALSYWMKWRSENPDARWTGERYGAGNVTADAPSSRPMVRDWNDTGVARGSESNKGQEQEDDAHGYGAEDSIPF